MSHYKRPVLQFFSSIFFWDNITRGNAASVRVMQHRRSMQHREGVCSIDGRSAASIRGGCMMYNTVEEDISQARCSLFLNAKHFFNDGEIMTFLLKLLHSSPLPHSSIEISD